MKIHSHLRPLRRNAGFTLLEMVIVLGIIAMILGGAIYMLKGIGDSAKLKQVDADFASLSNALKAYEMNAGSYPTTQQGLRALVEKPTTTPVPRRWVKVGVRVPLDPWKQEYLYRFPGKKVPTEFELVSKGPDGQEGTDDDFSSQDY
jgi:general secretion pathway protein G